MLPVFCRGIENLPTDNSLHGTTGGTPVLQGLRCSKYGWLVIQTPELPRAVQLLSIAAAEFLWGFHADWPTKEQNLRVYTGH